MNLMTGQHHVVHFFRGRETPASDAIRDLFRLIRLSKECHSLFALWISSAQLGTTFFVVSEIFCQTSFTRN